MTDLELFSEMLEKTDHIVELDRDNPVGFTTLIIMDTGNVVAFEFDEKGNLLEIVSGEKGDGFDSLLPYTNEGLELSDQ